MERLGLRLHPGKTEVWTADQSEPAEPQAARLWRNSKRHEGFVVCGASIAADDEDDGFQSRTNQ
eukprot:3046589-Prorocentrum_lima.AAC.1